MISLHEPTTNPAALAHDWYCPWWHAPELWEQGQLSPRPAPSLVDLADTISRYPWTPAIYRGGVRRESHFLQSRLIVLDYDEGLTLADAQRKFARFRNIIGTTKSHQKPKGEHPPCDRFRVVLFFMYNLYSMRMYKENYAAYVKLAKSDEKVKDGARFFFPCSEIISCNEGYSIPYLVEPIARINARTAMHDANDKELKKATRSVQEYHGTTETVKWKRRWFGMELWQRESFNQGRRNDACFKAACDLFEQGKGISDVESWILSVGTSLPEAEVRRTILSAQRKKMGA